MGRRKPPSAKRLLKRAKREYFERLNAADQETGGQQDAERQGVASQAVAALRLTIKHMEADMPNMSDMDAAVAAGILRDIALDFAGDPRQGPDEQAFEDRRAEKQHQPTAAAADAAKAEAQARGAEEQQARESRRLGVDGVPVESDSSA